MRYIIGIDLGTTNSAVAFIDTDKSHLPVELFSIPQLVAPGQMDSLSMLPSFCYLPANSPPFVGQWAKEEGAKVPTRLVQSAKSWLCNSAADRKERILPVEAADVKQRISPVEASAKYLIHLKETWNSTIAKEDLASLFEEQEIVLTVPASFDEVARTLTVEAARLAGLSHVTLLEEPQAAFYSWIAQHESTWEDRFKSGETILVCDVGGGTTDFSLIEIQSKGEKLSFQRMAVGDHLLLGGDNMDVALAHYLEKKLNHPLEGTQWLQLLAEARTAKEQEEKISRIHLQGSGSSVVKGSQSLTIERSEVEKLLSEGFFGLYSLEEALRLKKSPGFRTMGLPYEDEPSITKHLAHFLNQSRYFESGKQIDYLLFNGGTLKPLLFRQALLQSLKTWYPDKEPQELSTVSLDLAVARGAAYYGKVKRGLGVAIGGGLPRTYYLEVDVKEANGQLVRKALTLLPRGSEEGYRYQSEQIFSLRANTPVTFRLLTSHVRLHDKAGEMISIDEQEMHRLLPIQTQLRYGKESHQMIPVGLGIHLTAIGTVELWLEAETTNHRWNLEFQWRSAEGQDHQLSNVQSIKQDETFAAGYLDEAKQAVMDCFNGSFKPGKLMETLEELLHQERKDWAPSVLRGLWDPLIQLASQRKISLEHESRFWNLAGFLLRPGYGFPLDDFRIKELWKVILSDLKTVKNGEIQIAMWICFRRIAGGLNKGQQSQLASDLFPNGKMDGKRKGDHYAFSEKVRALATLERLDLSLKIKLGDLLLSRIKQGEGNSGDYWALGRIGARHLVYGSAGQVVPRDVCTRWIESLLTLDATEEGKELFTLRQLARKTDQRELNLSDKTIEQVKGKYPTLSLEVEELTAKEQEVIFGDHLPPGLILEVVKL